MMGNKDQDELDSDDSDEDFVVGSEEELSEESGNSDCEDEDLKEVSGNDEGVKKSKGTKRKGTSKKTRRSKRTSSKNERDDSPEPEKTDNEIKLTAEEEKQRADLLWKSFLSDTDTPSKSCTNSSDSVTNSAASNVPKSIKKLESPTPTSSCALSSLDVDKEPCNNEPPEKPVSSSDLKKSDKEVLQPSPQPSIPKRKGLSSFLSSIQKKSKTSVLEKSKLDWNQYKEDNNLSEEISTFNRGKSGFLERQDFLQRTDSRQFEIEKELRSVGKRSLR